MSPDGPSFTPLAYCSGLQLSQGSMFTIASQLLDLRCCSSRQRYTSSGSGCSFACGCLLFVLSSRSLTCEPHAIPALCHLSVLPDTYVSSPVSPAYRKRYGGGRGRDSFILCKPAARAGVGRHRGFSEQRKTYTALHAHASFPAISSLLALSCVSHSRSSKRPCSGEIVSMSTRPFGSIEVANRLILDHGQGDIPIYPVVRFNDGQTLFVDDKRPVSVGMVYSLI